jgi:hypothetical protein
MNTFSKIVLVAVSAIGMIGSTSAAPISAAGTSELAARGPNGVHNGWVSTFIQAALLRLTDNQFTGYLLYALSTCASDRVHFLTFLSR